MRRLTDDELKLTTAQIRVALDLMQPSECERLAAVLAVAHRSGAINCALFLPEDLGGAR